MIFSGEPGVASVRRIKVVVLASVAGIIGLVALVVVLQAGSAYARYGPGRTSRGATGTGPTPTPTPYGCPGSFPVSVVASPNEGSPTDNNQLNGVVALSPTNVWAVGSSGAQALIEHDDGTGWTIVPSPTPTGSQLNVLYGITAVSASDIWAVGQTTPPYSVNPQPQPLIEHWDGTTWTVSASPNIPGTYAGFSAYAVTAFTSTNVWLVGSAYFPTSGGQMLVEHWDGSAWTIVPVTSPSGDATLYALTALSPTNVWAVGQTTSLTGQTLIEHYDGTSWSMVPSAGPGQFLNYLTGVAAFSAMNVWAVGYATNYNSEPYNNQTLVEHWNGTVWSVVPSPNPGVFNSIFQAVTVDGVGGIWAVGSYEGYSGPAQALIEHWNGSSWTPVSMPATTITGASDFQLNGVAFLSDAMVWFVGYDYGPTAYYRTLVAYYRRLLQGIACSHP